MKRLLIIFLTSFSLLSAHPTLQGEETSLMHASLAADLKEMIRLILSGADVNAVAFRDQPHGGFPVLRYAIDSHSHEAVHLLLEAGANVHDLTESPLIIKAFLCVPGPSVRNLSLLSHAVHTKAPINIIEALLEHGADVNGNPKIASDWSALMIAAFVGYTEAVQVLLAAGANKTAVNAMDGKTALDYAQQQGQTEIIKLLA